MTDWIFCEDCDRRGWEVEVDGARLCPGCARRRADGLARKLDVQRAQARKQATRFTWYRGIYNGPASD